MDLVNYLISMVILGIAIQFGELWIVLGAATILILASKDIKASFLYIVTVGVLYFINSLEMNEYWLFAILGLIVLGYLLGLGNDAAPADPYAGLLGGDMGGMGM